MRHIQENLGFYYITGHGVPADLVTWTFRLLAAFYALRMDAKLALRVDCNQVGYITPKASVDRSRARQSQDGSQRRLLDDARTHVRRSEGDRGRALLRDQQITGPSRLP
ncbi:MAG: hypothetical protein FJX53_05505 [Alphaproteobacteria bacterium]|nr:hypothetical protein [Alphaproteobacteria bacterium]